MPLTQEQEADIYQEAYFGRLSHHKIAADSEDTATGLLGLAVKARKLAAASDRRTAIDVSANVKTANAFLDRFFTGDAALDQLIGAHTSAAK